MPNRLARESSPYLLQHGDNPVDWYPWGAEAFERARREDRPVLLSVGYSACHWCHVMERESFSDPETAGLMNEKFVNVKVDREERPDVDSLYMRAVQQMTGHGGWPMTVFLTPDGRPFYGGTYYPREPRPGLPSFRQVLEAVASAYRDRRSEVDRSAGELTALLDEGMRVNPEPGSIGGADLDRAYDGIRARYDDRHGGFGGAPKFPQPMALDFLLRQWRRTGAADALRMVVHTLDAMAGGGIHDHLGGGFHRYSVDARWLVPHFEKMLYDNALLGRAFTRAFQATREDRFREVAETTLDFLVREMRHDAGGFFSSQDADSEGEEGRFYTWAPPEIDDALGGEDGRIVRAYFGVSDSGNWEGRNVLNTPRPANEIAAELGMDPVEFAARVAGARAKLLDARNRRIRPARDEKVITSWNALAVSAFAEAARAFGRPDYGEIAVGCAGFLLSELNVDGTLSRTWRDGVARVPAFLEDHALLVDALVDVYGVTFDPRWVREARSLADTMIDVFWSPAEEMFFDAPRDATELVTRPRDIHDDATPSGTSAAALALGRLGRLTGEQRYERLAGRVVRSLGDVATRIPQAFPHLLCAVSLHLAAPTEVAIVGDPADGDTQDLLTVLNGRYLPHTTIALRAPSTPEPELTDLVPVLAGRTSLEGRATAYVCRRFTCRLPVSAPRDLERELDAVLTAGRES